MYNTKYHIQYPDINNLVTDIFIKQKDYIGDVVELESCGASPLTIKWYGEGEGKFSPIKQSEARINLLSTVNFEWEEFADFPEKEYMVEVHKGGSVYWIGYLIVDNYTEHFETPPYEVQITAIDYLMSLKDIDFVNVNGGVVYQTQSLLAVIRLILSKIGLKLPISESIDLMWSDEEFFGGLLHNTQINCTTFIDNLYQESQQPWKCGDVLVEILKAFGATIKQNKGKWEITNFDNQRHRFWEYAFGSANMHSGTFGDTKYLDSAGLKMLEGASMSVEGGKRSVNIIHNFEYKESVVKGGDFVDSAWTNNSKHAYFNNLGPISRKDNSLYFPSQFNNLHYGSLADAQLSSRFNYIEFEVDYARLPFGKSRIEHFLNFHFETQLVPEYTHPTGRGISGFNEGQYQSYLTRQLADFFDGLVWGEYFSVISQNATKGQTGNLYRQTDQENLFLYKWFVGGNSTWNPLIEPMLVFDKVEQRRYLNSYTKNGDAGKAVNFKNPDYGYYQMIPLYDVPWFDLYDDYKEIISPGDTGKLTVKISAPWFDNVKNYHTDIPSEYRINITGVNSFIQAIDFKNPSVEYAGDAKYTSELNNNFLGVLDEVEIRIGDSGVLNLGSLMEYSKPTSIWYRGTEALPLLQHTANRIIRQYNNPSQTLRGVLTSTEVIDLNTVIIEPTTDKTFRIQALELDDREALYNLELREINKPLDLGSYNMIRDNVGSGQIPLSELEGSGRSYLYDLAFALIACMGHRDYIPISDTIMEKLAAVQGINGGFSAYLLAGSPGGAIEFRTNAMVLYAVNYYLKHRVHRKSITDKAAIISKKLNGYIQSQYFQNPIGLAFDNNLINTVDNIVYWFALKEIDREKANRLNTIINNQLFNESVVYSGMTSTTHNQSKLLIGSHRLSLFAYLFKGDYSFIEHITDYFGEGISSGLLLGMCLYKTGDYSKYKDINADLIPLVEDDGNVLLPISMKIILNSRIKNTLFI